MAKSTSKAHLEKEIEQRIIRACPGALALKLHKRDWPDRLFLLPGGRCFFVEFKRTDHELRPGQKLAKGALEARGFGVYVVDSAEKGGLLIELWKLNEKRSNECKPI
jgi:hypothetical protein